MEYEEGMIAIFISHRWWDHPPGRPEGVYDWGGVDYVEGGVYPDGKPVPPEKANLKWRLICEGVDVLARENRLPKDKIVLWIDWRAALNPTRLAPRGDVFDGIAQRAVAASLKRLQWGPLVPLPSNPQPSTQQPSPQQPSPPLRAGSRSTRTTTRPKGRAS